MPEIDLNSDAGESYGAWKMGDDPVMFTLVSSVNIACGGHAGDYQTMSEAVMLAKQNGLGIGAHPSFEDKINFGRNQIPMTAKQIERMVAYQVGGFAAIAAMHGVELQHVKAHGALANLAAVNDDVADAIARATKVISPNLTLLAMAGTQLQAAGERTGLRTISEGFADRSYDENGLLMSRNLVGSVISDPDVAAQRCLDMAMGRGLPRGNGEYVAAKVESICVHGDTPSAVDIAHACRQKLQAAKFEIRPFSF